MILHIFQKDVRRLWPAIAVSLALGASVAWHDRWRGDWMSGSLEGYLNLLLALVWILLMGLAVEQEPMVGDRQFWLTRPYRKVDLLAAKLLFGVVFVHAPSLLADSYVLASRGFSPVSYAPELLAKQAVLACAVTLPATALATLVRGFGHFVLELVAVAAGMLLLSGSLSNERGFAVLWEPLTTIRRDFMVLCVAGGAVAIIGLQYLARRVGWSRVPGAVSAIATAAIYVWIAPHTAFAIREATKRADVTPTIQIDPSPRLGYRNAGPEMPISLPVVVDGFPAPDLRLDSLWTEIVTADGARYREEMETTRRSFQKTPYRSYFGLLEAGANAPFWIFLRSETRTFGSLRNEVVTFRGEAAATMSRRTTGAWMDIGQSRDIPGLGRCHTSLIEDRSAQRIKLECESPRDRQALTLARLWTAASGREWKSVLGNARRFGMDGNLISLSPLYREQTTWEIARDPRWAGDMWRIAASEVESAKIEVTPQEVTGYATVRYEFRNLDLRRYRGQPLLIRGAGGQTRP